MENTKAQLTDFLNKCEEVKNCKFIMATTKIKDLLKSIVNSAELYELFNTVATNFDYIAAKQQCFVEADGVYGHSRVILPDTVGDRLAFIFCLLVEFDRNDINFNAFLQKYYPKDGSYYASYHLFCDEVIGSLQAIICDVFAAELAESQPREIAEPQTQQIALSAEQTPANAQTVQSVETSALIGAVCMLIDGEKEAVEGCAFLSNDEKETALNMLEGLASAVKSGNAQLIKTLTSGYNYFVMQTRFVSECLTPLFEAVGEYLSVI